MAIIAFDIETGARPLDELKAILPPWNPDSVGPHPGEFNASAVKLGNVKDPAKINDKIADARAKHEAAVADYAAKQETGEVDHWQKIYEEAALAAVTGQVVAIGYRGAETKLHLAVDGVTERHLLVQFWKTYKHARATSRKMVGFRIKNFDIPFLAQRSWMLGVEVPQTILTPTFYLDSLFLDLDDLWKVGNRGSWGKPGFGTLDTIAKSLGIAGKPDDCTGAEFAGLLWSGKPEDREKAERYLEGDLRMVAEVAERLGVS